MKTRNLNGFSITALKMGLLCAILGQAMACQRSNPPPRNPPPPGPGQYDDGAFNNGGPNGPYPGGPNNPYNGNNPGNGPYNGNNPNLPPPGFDGSDLGHIPMLPMQPIDNGNAFDPFAELERNGQWVLISGQRFFRPMILDQDTNWQPYQKGYWVYDIRFSWTWVSFEPWGAVTDHYGIWRHHQKYGWVWMPFPDRKYQPHCVTWFDFDSYVGWYPYFPKYKNGYQFGFKQGFDDGYDEGFKSANQYLGVNIVNKQDVTSLNIYAQIQKNRSNEALVVNVMTKAHTPDRIKNGFVGPIPGGRPELAYGFISENARQAPVIGSSREMKMGNGQMFIIPPQDPNAPSPWKMGSKKNKKKLKKNQIIEELPIEQQPEERQPEERQPEESQPEERQPVEQQPEERVPDVPKKDLKKKNKKQIMAPKAPASDDSKIETEDPETQD